MFKGCKRCGITERGDFEAYQFCDWIEHGGILGNNSELKWLNQLIRIIFKIERKWNCLIKNTIRWS